MRVWAVSDIHTDYPDNLAWVEHWCAIGGDGASVGGGAASAGTAAAAGFSQDAVLIAGDVSDSLEILEKTLKLFAGAFAHVFFVPGNHDLWVRREERSQYDSLEKLRRVQALCARLGVHTEPAQVGGAGGPWVVPILSWYHSSWDREPDVPGATPINKVMMDFHACSWASQPSLQPPDADDSLARHFDALNEPGFSATLAAIEAAAAAAGGDRPPVISFSHFLPRQQLLPEKRMLYQPNLAKASGSDYLEERVRALRPDAHVFGHTHFSWDASIDRVRYLQWPLGYPRERSRRRDGGAGWTPLPLFDSAAGGMAPQVDCYWSEYYRNQPRNPANTSPAHWASVSAA